MIYYMHLNFPSLFPGSFVLGLIKFGFNIKYVLQIAVKTPQIISIIGFGMSALSFIAEIP